MANGKLENRQAGVTGLQDTVSRDPIINPNRRKPTINTGAPAKGTIDNSETAEAIDINAIAGADSSKKGPSAKNKAAGANAVIAGLRAGFEILNSNTRFNQISDRAMTNMMILENQQGEVMRLGRKASLKEKTKGFARGESRLLNAAARGQSVQGGLAQSAVLEEETIGVLNSINIELNAISAAFGIEQQQSLLEHEIELARVNRDESNAQSIFKGLSSGLGGFL